MFPAILLFRKGEFHQNWKKSILYPNLQRLGHLVKVKEEKTKGWPKIESYLNTKQSL